MRLSRAWPGIATALVLLAGTVVAIDGAAQRAEAQEGFSVSAEQLRINQKISQAAVRRSNRGLNYLAPIRTEASDEADEGTSGVMPPEGTGWTQEHIGDGAVSESKLAPGLAGRLPLWAVVEDDGTLVRGQGAVSVNEIATSFFRVDFTRNVRGCAYTATVGDPGMTYPGSGEVSVWSHALAENAVVVVTHDSAGALSDRPFHLTVNC